MWIIDLLVPVGIAAGSIYCLAIVRQALLTGVLEQSIVSPMRLSRDEAPFAYWVTMIGMSLIAILALAFVSACLVMSASSTLGLKP